MLRSHSAEALAVVVQLFQIIPEIGNIHNTGAGFYQAVKSLTYIIFLDTLRHVPGSLGDVTQVSRISLVQVISDVDDIDTGTDWIS
jgi:hypothetical protein